MYGIIYETQIKWVILVTPAALCDQLHHTNKVGMGMSGVY